MKANNFCNKIFEQLFEPDHALYLSAGNDIVQPAAPTEISLASDGLKLKRLIRQPQASHSFSASVVQMPKPYDQ